MIPVPVYDYRTDKVTYVEVPEGELWVCGRDFCDRCGDCMSCYGNGTCYSDGGEQEHNFVVYIDQLDEFMERHPRAVKKENEE